MNIFVRLVPENSRIAVVRATSVLEMGTIVIKSEQSKTTKGGCDNLLI